MFQTSDMQFGFKQTHSTVMCSIYIMKLVKKNWCNVYSCLLDASKAFDRVHYSTMFIIFSNKNVPYYIIRLLMDGYVRQEARVIYKSTYFRF